MTTSSVHTIAAHGLTEIFASPNPQVDIVLVHGLNGHPYNTWTAENGVFWPRDLLPQHLPDTPCRILTYGYDAKVSSFTDGVGTDRIHHHAENLAARLYSNRSLNNAVERPIIFIVHSLGGLVTKQCLIYSRSIEHHNSAHLRSIYLSTYGILFMGTPHNGSDLAKWGTMLQSIAAAVLPKKFFDSSSHLVESLKTNNETLQNINRQFNDIVPRLRIFFFYEARPTDLKGTRQFIVDETSAAPNVPGVERMGIERDHSHMCKFDDDHATGFPEVVEAVRRYAAMAPRVISIRWLEERHHRYIREELGSPEFILAEGRQIANGRVPHPPQIASSDNLSPQLPSHPHSPLLLEPGNASVHTPYEIEEHDADLSKSARLPYRPLADTTNVSSPQTQPPPSMAGSVPRLVRPRLVAPLGFRPNSHFVGFDIEMARLGNKLADESRDQFGARAVLLYGPPGAGKSHLAREYVWQHVEEYPNGVFWIDCKTPESLNKGFWNVAQTLGCFDELQASRPDAFIDAVRVHLAQHDQWLMIFDGISFKTEKDLEAFKRYVPDGRGSAIIYTTVDKTLANRQRLLDPPGIKVYPLSVDQACTLLYQSLHFRPGKQPNSTQQRKARQLVKHYDCLPLGIHAAAHMLLARGRALEKYTPGPSDNRLAAPFLAILDALDQTHQREAVNLLMIICFLNHEVPVVMLHYGHHALTDLGIEIRSMDVHGGSTRRELDNSIAVLLRNGLVERRLQTHSSASHGGRSSPEAPRAPPAAAERQHSDPAADPGPDAEGESQNSSGTLVGIDVIRVHTVVQQVYLDHLHAYSQIDFARWLTIATRFLIASWNHGYDKIKTRAGRGSVSDYREYESHAEKVWSHFPPRPDGVPPALRQARHDLHTIRRIIKREIENQSPSQSSNASERPIFASIFEKSGSSSDEGPATPTSGLTRMSTWSLDPDADATESPTQYQHPVFSNLPLSLGSSWHDDDGYLSDKEHQTPKMERAASNSTERPLDGRQHALRAIFEGRTGNDAYKPPPTVGSVSSADIELYHSRSDSGASPSPRLGSSTSLAEVTLSDMYRPSPPSKNSGKPLGPRPERHPLSELSSNSQMAPQQPSGLPRTLSTSPHLRQAILANTMRSDYPPVEENISVTRRSQPVNIAGTPWKPSLPTLESHSLPAEYGPVPMMRDLSHESVATVHTEPAEGAHSASDEYLTPVVSPADTPSQSTLIAIPRPHVETTAAHTAPPYPTIDSPDTEPLPILSPRTAKRDGLGISTEAQAET